MGNGGEVGVKGNFWKEEIENFIESEFFKLVEEHNIKVLYRTEYKQGIFRVIIPIEPHREEVDDD